MKPRYGVQSDCASSVNFSMYNILFDSLTQIVPSIKSYCTIVQNGAQQSDLHSTHSYVWYRFNAYKQNHYCSGTERMNKTFFEIMDVFISYLLSLLRAHTIYPGPSQFIVITRSKSKI